MPPLEPKRLWGRCRRLLRWGRLLLLLLLLIIASSLFYLNRVGVPRFVRELLETELRGRGLELQLGRVRLHGFRSFIADDLRIGQTAGTNGPHLFVQAAELRLKRAALARLDLQLEDLVLHGARLVLPFTASNAPPVRLAVEDITTELHFPARDQWDLARFSGRFLDSELSVSGSLTNALALRKWLGAAPSGQPQPNWLTRYHPIATRLQEINLVSPSKLALHLEGDGRDPDSFRATLQIQAPQASTPWGRWVNLQTSVELAPFPPAKGTMEANLQASFEDAQGDWGRWRGARWNASIVCSLTNQSLIRGHWQAQLQSAQTPWGDARGAQISGTTIPSPSGTAAFMTELTLDAEFIRSSLEQTKTNQFAATVTHSLTNLRSWEARWRWSAAQVESRWGGAGATELAGRIRRVDLAADQLQANAGWAGWAKLETYEIDWQVGISQIRSQKVNLDKLDGAGQWRAPNLTIQALHVNLYDGQFEAAVQLEVARRELQAQAKFDFDVQRISSLLTTNAQRWLQQFRWETPPRVEAQARLVLPAWTNAQPEWRQEVLPTVELSGFFEGTNGAFRNVAVTAGRSHFTLTNFFWRLPDLAVVRPDGQALLDYRWDMRTQDYEWDIDSRMDLMVLKPLFDPPQQRAFDFFSFTTPPFIQGKIWGRWHDPDRIGFRARAAATNFVFRGESCTDFRASVEFTNRFFKFSDVQIRRDSQQIVAPHAGYDLVQQVVYVTNAISTMEPDLVGRVIGPKIRAAIHPYRFDQPPTVRVNGRLPTRDTKQADVHFEVAGRTFHYWRFTVPEISGKLHWQGESLSISNVVARFYNGRLAWNGEFDFSPPMGTDFHFQASFEEADLRLLVADVAARTNQLEGILSGHLFITAANSMDWQNSQGFGDLRLQDGFLWNIPIFGFLSKILDKLSPGLGQSRANAASATYAIMNGVLHTSDLEVRSSMLRLQYAGDIDLKGQVNARMGAEILRDAPLVGRLVSLALSPVTKVLAFKITGSVNDPKREPLYLPGFFLWPFKPFHTMKQLFSHDDPAPPPPVPKIVPPP
jgi:hypothetical protein